MIRLAAGTGPAASPRVRTKSPPAGTSYDQLKVTAGAAGTTGTVTLNAATVFSGTRPVTFNPADQSFSVGAHGKVKVDVEKVLDHKEAVLLDCTIFQDSWTN